MNYLDMLFAHNEESTILEEFLCHPLNKEVIEMYDSVILDTAGKELIEMVLSTPTDEALSLLIDKGMTDVKITSANIPQFSNYYDIDKIVPIVKTNPGKRFSAYGYYFNKEASEGAKNKYGENHYKCAALLGLLSIEKPFCVTFLGDAYMGYQLDSTRMTIMAKLCLRIPLIQKLLLGATQGKINAHHLMKEYLSESTVNRRASNVKKMLTEICGQLSEGTLLYSNITWEK